MSSLYFKGKPSLPLPCPFTGKGLGKGVVIGFTFYKLSFH